MTRDNRNISERRHAAYLDARRTHRVRAALLMLVALVIGLLSIPFIAAAEEVVPVVVEPFPLEMMLAALISALTPIVLWGVKKLPLASLPSWLIPALAVTLVPYALDFVIGLAAKPGQPWWATPILGLVGIGLRELIDQLGKIGKAKQAPPALEV